MPTDTAWAPLQSLPESFWISRRKIRRMKIWIRICSLLGVLSAASFGVCQAPADGPVGHAMPYKTVDGRTLSLYVNEPAQPTWSDRCFVSVAQRVG
jgi:hypothetical protein